MRKAEAQVEIRSLHGGPETDPLDLELFGEPFAYSLHHVVHEAAREPVQRFHAARFCFTHQGHPVLLDARADVARQFRVEVSLGAFHRAGSVTAEVSLDLAGHLDRLTT